MKILAGDIGGTNTRLILTEFNASESTTIAEHSYLSADFNSLTSVIDCFISDHGIQLLPEAACFAVAGPVKSGIVSVTNLPWVVSEAQLSRHLKIKNIVLINDFVAVSYGLSELDPDDFIVLQKGDTKQLPLHPEAMVIGAGTGLGVSHRVWVNGAYRVFSSEAGHVGFAPANEFQLNLLAYLQKTQPQVSLEMLLSGAGLFIIYQYLCAREGRGFLDSIKNMLPGVDPAQLISQYALTNKDATCQRALACFIDIYGNAAGNAALHYYPLHEVYIAGGIAVKIKQKMNDGRFINAFTRKAAMSDNMQAITVKLITQARIGLYGALAHARALYLQK